MLIRTGTLSLVMVLFFHTAVLAHEGKPHVMGTVTSLDAQHVEVKTKKGQTVSIRLNSETKYRKGKAKATGTDLQVGDRVVIEATGEGETLTADEIRFASPGERKDHAKGHEGMPHHPTAP